MTDPSQVPHGGEPTASVTVLRMGMVGPLLLGVLVLIIGLGFASLPPDESAGWRLATWLIAGACFAAAAAFLFMAVRRPPVLTLRPEGLVHGTSRYVIPWKDVVGTHTGRVRSTRYLKIAVAPGASDRAVPLPDAPPGAKRPAIHRDLITVSPHVVGGVDAAQDALESYRSRATEEGETQRERWLP